MSTLDAVRTTLCLLPEASASDVLRAARDEIGRLSEVTKSAKNIQQRNGAKKKLADLQPMMAALEVQANLTAFEESIAKDGKGVSAAQRAAARVQTQKLTAQIAALPATEEKEVFQQWFADLNASLNAPPPAPTPPPAPPAPPAPVKVQEPVVVPPPQPAPPPPITARTAPLPPPPQFTPPPPPAPFVPPPPPPIDPTETLRNSLASLETKAKTRPLPEIAPLLRELESLSGQIAELPANDTRRELELRIGKSTTGLKLQEEIRQLGIAIEALEQNSKSPESDLGALSAECDRLTTRMAQLAAAPETPSFRPRVAAVKSMLATRRETTEIELAIKGFASRIEKGADTLSISGELDAIIERIAHLNDPAARTKFTSRLDPFQKQIAQRRNEEKVSSALEAVRHLCDDPSVAPGPARAALDEVGRQLQNLPPGPARTAFENQLRECTELVVALEAKHAPKPPQKAVALRLEPIKGRSAPSARPLVFVARERFSIGRQPDKEPPRADFLTPSAETRISRVHVTFLVRQGKINILAGEEGKPSTNPALLDDTPLTATPTPTAFDTERRIDLTGVLHLRAKLMPSATPFGPPLDEETQGYAGGATMVMSPVSGCLRIRPQGEDMLPTIAIWLFTDATIGAAPTCAVSLPQAKMAPEQARIHFWQKSFWVEALRASPAVELSGKPVATGASQPLRSDQELRLGDSYYTVRLT